MEENGSSTQNPLPDWVLSRWKKDQNQIGSSREEKSLPPPQVRVSEGPRPRQDWIEGLANHSY